MLDLAGTMLQGMARLGRKQLFVVVDEAQVAAEYLCDYFRSISSGTDMRPVLHAFHKFLYESMIFQGIILAGTGLSMEMVKKAIFSQTAKSTGSPKYATVYVELGRFTRVGQVMLTISASICLHAISPIGSWRMEYCTLSTALGHVRHH